MTRKSVSDLESHLGYWLRLVSNQVSDEFRLAVEAEGVSVADWVALRTLYGTRAATHGTLINALGMTKGAVSKLIARLEDKQLVQRAAAEADARLVLLTLTKAGQQLVPRLARLADANDRKFFAHLSPAQQAQLRDLLMATASFHQLRTVPVD